MNIHLQIPSQTIIQIGIFEDQRSIADSKNDLKGWDIKILNIQSNRDKQLETMRYFKQGPYIIIIP